MFSQENIDKNLSLVASLREIAAEKQITLPQLAVAWVLAKGEDIIPLIGARRVSQLQESLKSMDVHLSENDVKRIEQAIRENEIAGGSFPNMKFRNGIVSKESL
ncbi:aldo/keto reductase [Heyndrickxia acidicola]|uniref:Aldo/keto reductase n=1 Tax=Heyndrickxia acidicola TaxID=209389 RepID=A0ABU6MFR8_9BACI|nr:aldo/keto reductase [Heyndrickxia acidicola]MED1203253.1 aldo/keto reductase [Heyndrickxia acidicola]